MGMASEAYGWEGKSEQTKFWLGGALALGLIVLSPYLAPILTTYVKKKVIK